MRVDIGNALDTEATPGVSEGALERLDARVERAHERITRGMADGEFGYAALNLPERTDADAIKSAVDPVADAEAVLTVGIGGSALGAVTVSAALGASGHYALDNVDPARTNALLDALPLSDTVVNVVSRSGTTAETLANFLVVCESMEAAGVDWTERTVVTTGDAGPLRDLAERHDLPALDVPEGVPGRFSALSAGGRRARLRRGGGLGGGTRRAGRTRWLAVRLPGVRLRRGRPHPRSPGGDRERRDALRGGAGAVRGVVRTTVG